MKEQLPLETIADCANAAIAQYFHKAIAQEAEVLKDEDPEALHKMRVNMRRLRSALQILSPAINLPKAAQNDHIRSIAHTLGEVRDFDVLQSNLRDHYAPELPEIEQKQLKTVFKHLKKKRQQAFVKMADILAGAKYQNLKQAYQAWLEQPNYKAIASLPIRLALPNLLLPLIAKVLLHPAWLIGAQTIVSQVELIDNSDWQQHAKKLHDLRKLIKAARYQTEFFSDFYGQDYALQVKNFETIQSLLGTIQDSSVLKQLLTKTLKSDLATTIPYLFNLIQQEQDKAWQEYRRIQLTYLNPDFRQSLQNLILSPLPESLSRPENHYQTMSTLVI